MVEEISAVDLAGRIGTRDEPWLLDVRQPEEVAEWSIPGAVNIPLGELAARVAEVPSDREVVTVCASGARSASAAGLLSHAGRRAATLVGGMAAWGMVYDRAVVEAGEAHIVQVRRRGKGCLSYVVGARSEAVVVDPSADVDVYRRVADENGWRIVGVFDTHLHADHLSGARELARISGAILHLNPADTFDFDFDPLRDGQRFLLDGKAEFSVATLHTPGHTMGSTMYFVGDRAVLTGDTLFVDGVGRPDLAERAAEFARNLHRSLAQRVLVLPEDTLVLPGHYGESVAVLPGRPVAARLGELRTSVEALTLDEEGFVAWAEARTTPRPSNYVELVKANMGRPEQSETALRRLELGPNRCSA